MTVFQLLSRLYPEMLFKLKAHFPQILEFSKKVPVFPWKEEYNIADHNPEVIENLKALENLLSSGAISEEEYLAKSKKLFQDRKYASRTEGIAFIEEGFVSFRDEKPKIGTILHELGHIYFQEPDIYWNAVYGGGETLFWLALNGSFKISEEHIRRHMEYLKRAYVEPEVLGKELTSLIQEKVKLKGCVPHLYAYMLYAGTLPSVIISHDISFIDFSSENLLSIPYSTEGVLSFLTNLVEGLRYKDSFYIIYAKAINLIGE